MSSPAMESEMDMSNSEQDMVNMAKSLFSILPADVTLEEAQEERLNKV